jgi:hypothetical protein
MRLVRLFAAVLAVSVVFAPVAWAEPTEVGTTAATNTNTLGTPPTMATRNLFIGTNVFFEERIETSKTGQAQLLFLDESALTIASNSDVVLDKFVYDPKTSKGELALSVGAGVFRFVGGRISKTSAVTIKTPTATIGIRGGIIIIKVDPKTGATRATFVFGKVMTVTNKSGVTKRVTRPGFAIDVATLDNPPSAPFKVSGGVVAFYLTELEGRTGQTAGLTEPLTDVQVAGSGINQVGSSTNPEDIVTEETAATGGTTPPPPLPTIPNLENEVTSTNPSSTPGGTGVATSRTLTGFSGGVFQQLDSGAQLLSTSLFTNTSGAFGDPADPADIQIITDAVGGTTSNGTVRAIFDVGTSSEEQIVADFGGTGETSAFFNDTSFVIADTAASAEFEGAPVDVAVLFLLTSDLVGLPAGDFCQCEFLQWGFWGGALADTTTGEIVTVGLIDGESDFLAYWVAGEIPALLDMPTTGTATYSGHAIGTVNNDGNIFQAVGGYSQTYDFATGSGPFSVSNFDGTTYNGSVNAISGQGNLFTGTATVASPTRTLDLNGAFFSGGGDPVAEVGGGFSITGDGYEASGIVAATK